MNRIIILILFVFVCRDLPAQNVGIGTTSPANKLSVHGKVDIRDSLGIGTTAPNGELHVRSLGSAVAGSIDQQQTATSGSSGSAVNWQSFTAGTTGMLTQVDLLVSSPHYPSSSAGTIKIFNGQGNGGMALSTTDVTFMPVTNTFQSFLLSTPVYVTTGNVYTIEFSVPSLSVTWVNVNSSNPYAGGRANANASWDYGFKTYVSATSLVDALLVKDGITRVTDLQITNGANAGYILQSDASGNATWVNANAVEADPKVGALTNNKIPKWNGSTLTDGTVFDDGTNVGIGTNTPQGVFHVRSTGGVNTLDQQQLTGGSHAGGNTHWQSFTAGISGNLTRVDLYSKSPAGNQFSPGVLNIYSGEGTGGTLLSGTNVQFSPATSDVFNALIISTPVPIVAGQVYTFAITVPANLVDWMPANSSNPYAGGISNRSPVADLGFKTYVTPSGMMDALVIKDGNIGLGINTPVQRLHVVGTTLTTDLQITDGANAGYVLQSDATGNASWVNPATIAVPESDPQVGALSNNMVPKWSTSSLVNGIIFDDGTNVGIGTTSPTQKLDVAGMTRTTNLQITNGAGSGRILQSDASGNASWVNAGTVVQAQETDPQVGALSNNMVPKWNSSSLVNGMIFDNGTRVGIGTVTPDNTLSVAGVANFTGNVGIGITTPANALSVAGNSNFTGNVGIGITTASSVLHLQSPNNDNTPRGDIILSRHWGSATDTRASSIFHYNNSTTSSDNLAFGVSGNGGSFNQPNSLSQIKMLIQANGNVGVGTTAPSTTLDVEGGIRTKYCGSVVFDVIGGAVRTLTIAIPSLPAGWNFDNTFLAVTNVDGVHGHIRQAKITGGNSIDIKYIQDSNGTVRFNWIIFKM